MESHPIGKKGIFINIRATTAYFALESFQRQGLF